MIKKIWGAISAVLAAAVVLLAVLLVGARVIGLQVYTVLSGSMEPNYHVGSIIYVQKADPKTLQKGDVISFMINENTVATHRIVEVVPDEKDPSVLRFRTKGDANQMEDNNLVHYKNVLGKVVGTIPLLGYVSDFVQHPPGTYITIGAVAILVMAVFLPDIIGGAKALKAEEAAEQSPEATKIDNEKLKAELEALKQKIQQNQTKEVKENEEDV